MFMPLTLFTSNSLYPCLPFNQGTGTTKSFCVREFLIHIFLNVLNLLLPQNICNGFLFFSSQSQSFCGGAESPCPVSCLGYKLEFPPGESTNLPIPLPGYSSVQSPVFKQLSEGMFPSLYLQSHGIGCKCAVHLPLVLVMA